MAASRVCVLALLLFGAPVAVNAQRAPKGVSNDERRLLAAIDTNDIRVVLTTLADRRMQGRMPGTAGDDSAEAYLARRFAEIGLRPLGDNGTYFQRVPIRQISTRRSTALSIGAAQLRWQTDFSILPGTSRDSIDVSGPVTYLRYGRPFNDTLPPRIPPENVRGRIVVLLVRQLTPTQRLGGGTPYRLYNALGRAGAAAVVITGLQGPRERAVPPRAQLPRLDIVAGDEVRRPPALPPTLVVRDVGSRRIFAALGLDYEKEVRAAEAESIVWRTYADRVGALTMRSDVTNTAAHNVVGLIEGRDPVLRHQAVVLSAHHDHLGVSSAGEVFAGAVDNAMGSADVFADARAISRSRVRPRRSFIVLITTGEEYGLLGARYWVAHPTWSRANVVVADVNLEGDDPLAPWKSRKYVVAYNADSTTLAHTFATAARALGHVVEADPMPEEHAESRSDALAFQRGRIPAAFVFVFPDSGVAGGRAYVTRTARFYHQPADTARTDWSYDIIAEKARLALLFAWRVANADSAPRFLGRNSRGR